MTYAGQARIAGVLAIGLLVIAGASQIAVMAHPIPEGNETIAGQAIGSLYSLLGIVVGFFYGISSGNRKDSETIAAQAQTIATLTPTPAPTVTVAAGDTVTVTGTGDAP